MIAAGDMIMISAADGGAVVFVAPIINGRVSVVKI
jgi:hypothetical protein